VEKHDDLVDAFVILILGILAMDNKEHFVYVTSGNWNHINTPQEIEDNKKKSEIEKKIENYRRLQDLNDRGFFL